jgi:hypothetical protein
LLHAKNNLARAPQGLAFRLEQCIVADDIVASRAVWNMEPVLITADEALAADAAGTGSRTAKAEATEFLRAVLADGPVPAAEVNRMAREHGLTTKVIRSAREALGVKIERDGFGPGSKSLWSFQKLHRCPRHILAQYNIGHLWTRRACIKVTAGRVGIASPPHWPLQPPFTD